MSCSFYFDIGNTTIKIGVSRSGVGLEVYVIPTDEQLTADQFGLTLEQIAGRLGVPRVIACIASSVVPSINAVIDAGCRRYLGVALTLVPEDIPVPLENHYARPHEVGADRLVGAFAARRLFPENYSIISVDFGTATTFDCVEGNAYLGGLICPGVLSSASALAGRTAKLPRISLDVEDAVPTPGISTATSLNHGFIFGFAAMTEGVCARLAATMKGSVMVVGTGGFAEPLAKVTDCFGAIRPDLLLEGLQILHSEQVGKNLYT